MKIFKTFARILLIGIASLIVLFIVILVYFSVVYSPEYVRRSAFVGEATVYDYLKIPSNPLDASSSEFHFVSQLDEGQVQSKFESNPKIKDLEDFLTTTGTQAFIVIKNDAILYEQYFNNSQRDSIVVSFSVAKSITSALVGMAIQDGFIKSVDDPITVYLPELASRNVDFEKITIRHLLTMTSGIRYDENRFLWHDESNLTYRFPDLRSLALNKTVIVEPPGKTFLYNDYNPILLGLILERATGKSVTVYLQEKIWTPLGMEFGGSWSLDGETSRFELMSCCINARAIDFAKFGRLYLLGGAWNGEQLVPVDWVADSVQFSRGLIVDERVSYGYLWWEMSRDPGPNDFFALGNLGQLIYISPQNDLIIVRNGEKYGLEGEGPEWAEIFYQFASDLPK